MDEESLGKLRELMKEEIFPEGSCIIKEGDIGDTMYLLISGKVDVVKTTLYGEAYLCATLEDKFHCVFGEIALVDRDRRSATVKAKTECRTLSVSAEVFQRFCDEYPAVGCKLLMFIATNLCRNLRNENENLTKVYQALIEEIEGVD